MTYILATAVFVFCLVAYRRTSPHEPTTRLFFRLGMIGAGAIVLLHFVFWNVIVYTPEVPPPGGG